MAKVPMNITVRFMLPKPNQRRNDENLGRDRQRDPEFEDQESTVASGTERKESYIDGQEHKHAEERHKTFHDDDAKAKAAFKDIKASIIEAKMNVDDLQAEINDADAEIEELFVEREAADDAAERAKYER